MMGAPGMPRKVWTPRRRWLWQHAADVLMIAAVGVFVGVVFVLAAC